MELTAVQYDCTVLHKAQGHSITELSAREHTGKASDLGKRGQGRLLQTVTPESRLN